LNRSESILELLRRCYANQDGPHRWMRNRKPYGGFWQVRGQPLFDERQQAAGARDIDRRFLSDRFHRRLKEDHNPDSGNAQ
jgi:hypothetical protein